MKLIYLADIRLPTERAHGIQIMKMCESFARTGAEVVLIIPTRKNPIDINPFLYYGIEPIFKMQEVFTPNLLRWGKAGFILHGIFFALISFVLLLFRKRKSDILYSRDEVTLFLPAFFGWQKVFWEAHTPKNNKIAFFVARHASGIIPITQSLEGFFHAKGVSHPQMVVAHDAVDLKQFHLDATKEECRKRTGLSGHRAIVLYAGHLYERKGAFTLADAAAFLPDITFVFIGGNDHEIASLRSRHEGRENILIVGRRPHQDVPAYLKAADVVVLPNSAKDPSSERYTSPMKLFEYMASGTPIVASGVTAIKEILNESNAVLVAPDDPRALAEGIRSALSDPRSKERAGNALRDIRDWHTWDRRAESILSFTEART